MHRTREILRQKWALGRSHRDVAASVGVSAGVVGKTVIRARGAGLDWAEVESLDDEQLDLSAIWAPGSQRSESARSPTACGFIRSARNAV